VARDAGLLGCLPAGSRGYGLGVAGLLVTRFPGLPGSWVDGPRACWCTGLLVYWGPRELASGQTGLPLCWQAVRRVETARLRGSDTGPPRRYGPHACSVRIPGAPRRSAPACARVRLLPRLADPTTGLRDQRRERRRLRRRSRPSNSDHRRLIAPMLSPRCCPRLRRTTRPERAAAQCGPGRKGRAAGSVFPRCRGGGAATVAAYSFGDTGGE
jgi:hypothetical protein